MTLYIVMALAAFIMIWAYLQYKSKGVSWGRPLSGICGVIALLSALGAILHNAGFFKNNKAMTERYNRINKIKYETFANKFAELYDGKSVVIVAPYYPVAEGEESPVELISGLIGGNLELEAVYYIESEGGMGEEMMGEDGEVGYSYPEVDDKYLIKDEFTVEVFEERILEAESADVILFMTSFPEGWEETEGTGDDKVEKYWDLFNPKRRTRC